MLTPVTATGSTYCLPVAGSIGGQWLPATLNRTMKYAVKNEANSIASEPRNSSMASVAWLMCRGCSSGAPPWRSVPSVRFSVVIGPPTRPARSRSVPSVDTCSMVIVPAALMMSSVISS